MPFASVTFPGKFDEIFIKTMQKNYTQAYSMIKLLEYVDLEKLFHDIQMFHDDIEACKNGLILRYSNMKTVEDKRMYKKKKKEFIKIQMNSYILMCKLFTELNDKLLDVYTQLEKELNEVMSKDPAKDWQDTLKSLED